MRNPKWHRDEIILALDLYFSKDRGGIDDKNPRIIELSKTLNGPPLFPDKPDQDKFRNANGVTLKLSNLLSLVPDYKGNGMAGRSKVCRMSFLNHLVRKFQDECMFVGARPFVKAWNIF